MIDLDQFDKHQLIYFPCNGKLPAIKKWQELTQAKRVKGKSNYGILCGQQSNITVVDIDLKSDGIVKSGMEIWSLLLNQFNNGEQPETPIVKTGRGGYHIFYKYNPNIKNGTHCMSSFDASGYKVKYAIDIRNNGGYVVCAGSIHPDTKKKYKFEQEFDECGPIDMPNWLVDALTKDMVLDGDTISFVGKTKPIKTTEILEGPDHIPEEFDVLLFREIIANLDKNRAHSYDDWIKVCWGVGAIDRLFGWNNLDSLVDFSKKSDKFSDDSDVEKHYNEGDGSIGLGSFWHWLKDDNPEKFNELYKKYKKESNKKFYYGNYKKLVKKHEDRGYLYKSEVKDYLRGSFVKIDNAGNTRWLSRNKDDDGADQWELLHKTPFIDNKINIKIKNGNMDANDDEQELKTSFYAILQEFSVHPEFPIYDKLDFRPYLHDNQKDYEDEEIFNLFNGFMHSSEGNYDETLIEPILEFMRNVLSAGNEEFYTYYINYLAHAIQFPNEKPGVAIIFISPQGLGKDLINHDFMKRVFGNKLLHRVDDLSDMTRKFNKKLEGKLITIVGEIRSYCNDLDIENLKGKITNTTINIEPKGKDPYEIRDYGRLIAHTNNTIPIGIESDDRRFVIHKIAREFVRTREYYNNLAKVIKKPEVALHFFKYLAQRDLTNFDVRERPETIAKKELQILTASNVYRFMAEVYTKRWNLVGAKIKDEEIKIHTNVLYENYKNWANEAGEKNKQSLKIFKQKLEACDFAEHNKQFKLYGSGKMNGYKTSYTKIYECFKLYINEKNNNDDDEEPESDED